MIELPPSIIVLSPHLDDAVLSVGATIAGHVADGGAATVVTVFAGDPESLQNAGSWDERAGFTTAGAAARFRRAEDAHALERVGASHVWLSNLDGQYRSRRDPGAFGAQLAPHIAGADAVLVPGLPLVHGDHAWATLLALRVGHPRIIFYAEEPYLTWLAPVDLPPPILPASDWDVAATRDRVRDADSKLEAVRRYRSQMEILGDEVRERELAKWLDLTLHGRATSPGEQLAEMVAYSRT